MLEPLLEEVDHLILAGDLWQERVEGPRYKLARRMYREFLELLDERGISTDILCGNHDPSSGEGVAWLAEKQVLVNHGDAIYDEATPWSREMPAYRKEIAGIVARHASESHRAEVCATRAKEIAIALKSQPMPRLPPPLNYFATVFWPPSRTIEMVRVFFGLGEESIKFLKQSGEGARILVCGHFHRPGVWEKDGYLVINTGAFMMGSRPWLVDLNHGSRLTARDITFSNAAFQPGEVRGRWLLSESAG